jgi:hypothetical protein
MAGNDTLVFCTSFFRDQGSWESRYVRWLEHHLSLPWDVGAVAMIDDGSPFKPEGGLMTAIAANDIGRKPLSRKALIRFPNNLGRSGITTYPGWWRSFLFSLDIAECYGFRKIVHVESDTFLLSRSILRHIEQTRTGWTAFWTDRYQFPETALQILCADAFPALREMRDQGIAALRGKAAELILPFTNVEQNFVGDRYSEFQREIPEHADYAVQVLPTMRVWKPAAPMRRLANLFGTPLEGTIPPAAPPRIPTAEEVSALPDDSALDMALRVGSVTLERGDFESARICAEKARSVDPGNRDATRLLVASLFQQGKLQDALAAASNQGPTGPTNADLENLLGGIHATMDAFEPAAGHFHRAIVADPTDRIPLANLKDLESRLNQGNAASLAAERHVRDVLFARFRQGALDERGHRSLLLAYERSPAGRQEMVPVAQAVSRFRTLDAEESVALAEILSG